MPLRDSLKSFPSSWFSLPKAMDSELVGIKKKKTPYYITDTARINILNIIASNCAKDPIESEELFR